MDEPERLFTVEEANAELPELREQLERIRAARGKLIEGAKQISENTPTNGGRSAGGNGQDPMTAYRADVEAISAKGIILRDPETGLVDFPGERDGERVLLCWRLGEESVGFWHSTDSGFTSRKPL